MGAIKIMGDTFSLHYPTTTPSTTTTANTHPSTLLLLLPPSSQLSYANTFWEAITPPSHCVYSEEILWCFRFFFCFVCRCVKESSRLRGVRIWQYIRLGTVAGDMVREWRCAHVLLSIIYASGNSGCCYGSVVCYKSADDTLFGAWRMADGVLCMVLGWQMCTTTAWLYITVWVTVCTCSRRCTNYLNVRQTDWLADWRTSLLMNWI